MKQAEQSEKIYKAVEALKKEPDSDKKTAFWNAYKELADEYDTEFKEKYGSDLDTTLIFAGLFSAVSSAFIIQIEPQLMMDPPNTKVFVAQSMLYVSLFTTLLAAFLAVLGKQWIMFYQAVGGRGTIEDRGLERQRKLDGLRKWKFDAVLQMFPLLLQLALLLFSTAISVYLWTVNRSVAFIMLALTSVGFGVYMLLLGSAIVSRDSPFRTPLAPFLVKIFSPILNKIFIALNKLNWQYLQPFSWHLYRLFSRLRGLLEPVLSCFRWAKPGTHILPRFITHIRSKPTMVNTYPNYDLSGPSAEAAAVLWVLETTTDPTILDLAVEMGADLQWPLDADLLSPMSGLRFRFLECFDSQIEMSADNWYGYKLQKVRKGMSRRAIQCGIMCCSMMLAAQASKNYYEPLLSFLPCSSILAEVDDHDELVQLLTLVQLVTKSPDWVLDCTTRYAIQWTLHILPSIIHGSANLDESQWLEHFLDQLTAENLPNLDEKTFTNYLCCLDSILGPMDMRMAVEIDKTQANTQIFNFHPLTAFTNCSRFETFLLTQLFIVLQTATIDPPLVKRIIRTTHQLMNETAGHDYLYFSSRELKILVKEMSGFCATFPRVDEWLDIAVIAATLGRLDSESWNHIGFYSHNVPNMEWIYMALEHIQQSSGSDDIGTWDSYSIMAFENLLQLLACSSTLTEIPALGSLRMILQALCADGDISLIAAVVLHEKENWLLDPNLQSIMQQYSVWSQLGRVAIEHSDFKVYYIGLGGRLANTAHWKPFIYQDLPTWITTNVFGHDRWGRDFFMHETFMSVIRNIWAPDFEEHHKFADDTEKSWALAISALSNVWKNLEFIATPTKEIIRLARCTISASLCDKYFIWSSSSTSGWDEKRLASAVRGIFASRLGASLTHAARNIVLASHFTTHVRIADLLAVLGNKLGNEFESGHGEVVIGGEKKEYKDWDGLNDYLVAELDALEDSSSPENAAR
ncbi:hypothetical protein B0H11DRAFT_1116475 [Mycena galericulata]|nr:hypothetical protein B0H11DRAFT_1116475 [Mycena galericulata]